MHNLTQQEKFRAYAAWLAVCFFWGTTYLAIKIGAQTLPVALFSGSRFFIAGTILFILCYLKKYALPQGRDWLHLSLVGLLLITCANGLLVWSSRWVPSGMAAILVTIAPFWMVGLEAYKHKTRIGLSTILGIIVGFIGVALLIAPQLSWGTTAWDHHFLMGVIALQIGCFCWCLGSIHSKHYPSQAHPLVSAAVQMLAGGTALLIYGTIDNEWPRFIFNHAAGLAFIYLVIFGAVVGYGCYIYALDKLPSATVSTYAYINPIIAITLGVIWLKEPFTWTVIGGTGIILAGVALVKQAEPRI